MILKVIFYIGNVVIITNFPAVQNYICSARMYEGVSRLIVLNDKLSAFTLDNNE